MPIRYICVSKTCRREVEIETSRKNGTFFSPTCECGSEMKKVYSGPAFTRLSGAEATERFGEFVRARKR
jgi:hypothetical protein